MNKTGERQIGRIQKKWGGDRTDNVNVDHEYFDVTCKLHFSYLVTYFCIGWVLRHTNTVKC